ncbi:MAG: polyprenyl synthetase family protein, partial [Planctomycetota bacterium]
QSKKIEKELSRVLPREKEHPARLSQAMRYAVLSGGKRIRPILALEACRAVGGRPESVMPAALALELIHSYSLVHDDLPCMDNDLSRRGKPSCHVKFGEVTALLAGDALLTLAFEILCRGTARRAPTKGQG